MTPTRVEALRRMAHADESPNEREIARTKLAEAGIPVDPPRPPAPPAASPMPGDGWSVNFTSSTSGSFTMTHAQFTVTLR